MINQPSDELWNAEDPRGGRTSSATGGFAKSQAVDWADATHGDVQCHFFQGVVFVFHQKMGDFMKIRFGLK